MFAMLSVMGFMAGAGSFIYRRATGRASNRDFTYQQAFQSMENGAVE
jgi:hypothetical protein